MDKIIFKKLSENATIPSFAHKGDAGLDLCASERCEIAPKSWGLVKTGLAVKLPNGTEAQIRSRSGLALKRGVFVLNSPGTIDEGYRGEVGIILCNLSDENFVVNVGDRIAQMVVKIYLEPNVEKIFHEDSYGYRPNKSAIQAIGVLRERCWRKDWVVDFDIKGLFEH